MKPDKADPQFLPVMESFYTIQGEGNCAGEAAYFIRLGGCDVGCHWCDVKESWDASQYDWINVEELASQAKATGTNLVVVTGGEPLMYDLSDLTKSLKKQQLRVNIETAGVYPITGDWDWICFSPKKFKQPILEYYEQADELKVVIYNKHDFDWAVSHGDKMHSNALKYLQPEWSKAKQVTPLIVDFVKENPEWRISVQTHKYMDIP